MIRNKVLLIFVNSMLENVIPISVSLLSSCLKEAGFEVRLFDTTFYKWGEVSATENRIKYLQIRDCPLDYNGMNVYEDLNEMVENYQPDIIGLSTVECTHQFALDLLQSIQDYLKESDVHVSVGGVHAIFAPEVLAVHDMIDSISIGEAEKTFVELCERIRDGKPYHDVGGFWLRKSDGQIQKNNPRQLTDLDSLPFLDFDIYEKKRFMRPMMGKIYSTVITEFTRGCPYHCSYCGDTTLKNIFKHLGGWFRQKSINNIYREIAHYVKRYQAKYLYIMSESFLNMSQKRFDEFYEMYSEFKLPFWFNTRPESINEEKIKRLKELNCHRISVGIEHGNEMMRRGVLKRSMSNDQIINACRILDDYAISYSVNAMIGFPDETRELAFDTVRLCRQVNADGISVHIFNPYRGSELREYSIRKKYIPEDLIAYDFFLDTPMRMPQFPRQEIIKMFKVMPMYIKFPEARWDEVAFAEKMDDDLAALKKFEEIREEFIKTYF